MLVLTRRLGERVCIGKNIEIVPIKQSGKQITLGINAPSDLAIYRKEGQTAEDRQEKLFVHDLTSATRPIPNVYNVFDREYGILRFNDFKHKLNYSRRTLGRRVKEGLWTKPVRLSAHTMGWPIIEIETLITAYITGYSDDAIRHLVEMLETARQELVS